MKIKILLTGGGTAGHIWPIISVIDILKKDTNIDYLYVGSRQGLEKNIAKNYNIKFKGLIVGKWRNYFSISNFGDILKTVIGLFQAYFLILSYKPNIVFAKGGYVTAPILFWTKVLNIPLVIHESDVIPGKANLWAAGFARRICVGFPPNYYSQFKKDKVVYTGTPIKDEFVNSILTHGRTPSILITGGSQGSGAINHLIKQILPQLLENYEVYHLLGQNDFNIFKDIQKNHDNYFPEEFSNNMAEIMAKANLVVTRSGANTLTEISALAKPSILIPYPNAASNHQMANANVYKENGAAIVLVENNLTSTELLKNINELMKNPVLLNNLGSSAHKLFKRDSAQIIVNIILKEGIK